MTKYVRQPGGAIQSVSDEHFAEFIGSHSDALGTHEGPDQAHTGLVEVTEDEARALAPYLFGAAK